MVHNGQLWREASQAMWDLLNELDGQPWKLTEEQVKDYLLSSALLRGMFPAPSWL